MPHVTSLPSSAPERRLTPAMRKRLERLAPLFEIHVEHRIENGEALMELSGPGFSEGAPLVLSRAEGTVRLLAEICSILTRWIPFSLWEPCEVTLFALPHERIERCAASFRKQLAQQARAAERAAATRTALEALSSIQRTV